MRNSCTGKRRPRGICNSQPPQPPIRSAKRQPATPALNIPPNSMILPPAMLRRVVVRREPGGVGTRAPSLVGLHSMPEDPRPLPSQHGVRAVPHAILQSLRHDWRRLWAGGRCRSPSNWHGVVRHGARHGVDAKIQRHSVPYFYRHPARARDWFACEDWSRQCIEEETTILCGHCSDHAHTKARTTAHTHDQPHK